MLGNLSSTQFSIDEITNILSSSQSTFDKAQSIKSYLNRHHEVTSLQLHLINLGVEDAQALTQSLKGTNVTALHLSFKRIGTEGANALAEGLIGSNVTSLNLSGNHIGDEGVRALAEYLKYTNVTSLNLGDNGITSEGVRELAEGLIGSNVTSLNLRDNIIGDAGARALAEGLKNTNVTSLNLRDNIICDEGARALAEYLKYTNVTNLNLGNNEIGNNDISDEGARALALFLKNSNVTTLNLDQNPSISRGNKQKLDAIITANRERIANERSSALVLIRQHCQNQDQGVNTLSDDVLLFPERGSLEELEYMTGIILNGDLPRELLYHILSFVPSLVLPSKNGPISILDRLYEINNECSERLMIVEAPTQTTTSGFFGTLWGMLPSLLWSSQIEEVDEDKMDIDDELNQNAKRKRPSDFDENNEPDPRKKRRLE